MIGIQIKNSLCSPSKYILTALWEVIGRGGFREGQIEREGGGGGDKIEGRTFKIGRDY